VHQKMPKRVILRILDYRQWTERKLAAKAKLSPTVVSRHLSGRRKIQPEHLIKYLDCLDHEEASHLLVAWLRDRVGALRVDELVRAGGELQVDMTGWRVDPEQEKILRWWARETARDGELGELFKQLSARFGYKPRKRKRR
jgi:transcriptional regulator with XRE-family HTH domain